MVHGPGWSVRLSMDLGPCFVYVCFHVHVYDEKQAQLGVVHGPGPQRWSMDRVHGVVHGPGPQGWSMDPGPCFVYVRKAVEQRSSISSFMYGYTFDTLRGNTADKRPLKGHNVYTGDFCRATQCNFRPACPGEVA